MNTQDDINALAGDYVLGHLEGEAHARADARMRGDVAFARIVESLRLRLSELDDTAEAMTPPVSLWARIEAGLSRAAPAMTRNARGSIWQNLPFWRATGLAASLATAMLAIAVVTISARSTRELAALADRKPVYVAVLVSDSNNEAGAVVNAFANGRVEMIPLKNIEVPPGRALEIWTLWDRSVGPRSVGLIDSARTISLKLDALPETANGQLFEITLEPATGSPIGRPTGPILYKGLTARAL